MVKSCFFAYSNFVDYGFVGNTISKLLQFFAIMQRIKNDVLSLIENIDLNFFTDPQYRKIVQNQFNSTQVQIKTTWKIEIHINKKYGEKMCI